MQGYFTNEKPREGESECVCLGSFGTGWRKGSMSNDIAEGQSFPVQYVNV